MARLASVDGYDSVHRYRTLGDGPKYLGLYEVQDDKLHEALGGDLDARHPNTYIDGPKYDNEILPHVDHFEYSFYLARDGREGDVVGDGPVAVFLADPDEGERPAFIERLVSEVAPELERDPRVVSTSVREALHDPQVPPLGFSPTPSVLMLIQFADVDGARSFVADPPAALAEEGAELTAYGLVAQLFPMPREELFRPEAGEKAKQEILAAIAAAGA
ncbi:MAG: hypothetical protein BGO11_10345 [Solirubrobacterales bacterium 70-9]|nr:MAG: hypothetical protein BGO11_10345 [Solirubrobacterales bacterium 70-9]